jgi:hypothetical protein
MEGNVKNESIEREEIFSKAVRAGKRTYFFDVKTTRRNDYYLTITERKKRVENDGKFSVEKHKLFLYKEDFEKFREGLAEVVEFIDTLKGDEDFSDIKLDEVDEEQFSNFEFEDLVN